MIRLLVALLIVFLTVPSDAWAQNGVGAAKPTTKKNGKAVEKHIIREGKINRQDKSKIDFDEADITGARKTPLGTLVNQNKADKNYDFVKIRLRWPQEMVQSASSLESGRSK